MLKNLLFLLFFIQAHHSDSIFSSLDTKFSLSNDDNKIYIFQSKHKRERLSAQEIKDNALIVVKKLHQWKIPSIHIIQVLHIKNLPRFVPQKVIHKKLIAKAKDFENLILLLLNEVEKQSFKNIQFHWYIDQGKNYFRDLGLSLNEPHLFVKSENSLPTKSSPKLLKKSDFHVSKLSIESKSILKP